MRYSHSVAAAAALFATPALGWGDAGHQITATIAQIHLLPSARQAICGILPERDGCSLAKNAIWPDIIKKKPEWKWTSSLHFVNGKDDYPPEKCTFGKYGWTTDQNILHAIVNNTRDVASLEGEKRDHALRFLTHFLGDVHMPLHMTGRDVGGNLVPVIFEGKNTSLHFMWDDLLINQRMRTLPNYTQPLPTEPSSSLPPSTLIRNRHIENALAGDTYDPLVRWIVLEGIYGWWYDDLAEWTTCPRISAQSAYSQSILSSESVRPPFEDPVDVPVCPYHWAEPSHQMICDFIWRSDFKGVKNAKDAVYEIELNTPEYAGRIRDEKMVERQLALGGMRLAATLNEVLGSEEEKQLYGVRPLVF